MEATMVDQSHTLGHLKHRGIAHFLALVMTTIGLSVILSEAVWAQQFQQRPGLARRTNPPQRPPGAESPAPALEPTSALGQAIAACDKDAAVQDTFALPGLKGEVTLDRCYKGRAHLICVFTALATEAKSLTSAYTKIVDAKYPDINNVDNICHLKPDALASDIAGSEDFTNRFATLKAQYETATKCGGNVKQAFRDVVLTDMAQPPEILKCMTDFGGG
jgi:hypothetical protein